MKIEYGSHCFGDIVRIDGSDIVQLIKIGDYIENGKMLWKMV